MSPQRDEQEEQVNNLPDGYAKIDKRYRESKYFLADQLRYSESVQDFRSVKQAIQRSAQFSIPKRAFEFVRATIN